MRDSTMHLITSSQQTGFGFPAGFGGSSFHGSNSHSQEPLLLISATSIGSGVIHLFDYPIVNVYWERVNLFCVFPLYNLFFIPKVLSRVYSDVCCRVCMTSLAIGPATEEPPPPSLTQTTNAYGAFSSSVNPTNHASESSPPVSAVPDLA